MSANRLTIFICLLLLARGTFSSAAGRDGYLTQDTDTSTVSLSERLFKVEKKNDAFNLYFDIRGGIYDILMGDETGARLAFTHFRPNINGTIGKWSYKVRLNLLKEYDYTRDGASSIVDILMVSYRPTEHWSFTFGKKWFNYGTYEFEANALQILEFFEYDYHIQDGGFGLTLDAFYHFGEQTIGIEIANASRTDLYEAYPAAKGSIEKIHAPFQYSVNWLGRLFNDHLNTTWSYTLLNQAKGCFTNQLSMGTKLKFRKVDFILDYFGGWGYLDNLGIINKDAEKAGYFGVPESPQMITGTSYHNLFAQIEIRPARRWNIMFKGGFATSSADKVEMFRNYRKTYEYIGAVQFFPDLTQDLKLSLAYIGKHTRFSTMCGLDDINYGRLELSLIYRLKAY